MLDLLCLSLLLPAGAAAVPPPATAPPFHTGSAQARSDELTIEWRQGSLSTSLAEAVAADAPVFVYFWSNDSQHCAAMWGGTLDTPRGRAVLRGYVCHSAPIGGAETPELLARYAIGVLPTVLVLDAEGQLQDGLLGVMPPLEFEQQMARIAVGTDTLGDLRARAAADPEDLDVRYTLALKLEYLGQQGAADEVFDSIRRDDPRGRTLIGARLQLLDVQRAIEAAAPDPGNPASFEPQPLRDLLRQLRHDAVRFEAWTWLAQVEAERGDGKAQREALAEAWPLAEPDQQRDFGAQLAFAYWAAADELSGAERRLAQRAAAAAAALAELALAELAEPASRADEGADEWTEGAAGDWKDDAPEGLSAAEQRAAQGRQGLARNFAALACGESLVGNEQAAVQAIERAIDLAPGNLEFRALFAELREG